MTGKKVILVDSETGESSEQSERPFVKMYFDHVSGLNRASSGAAKVMVSMVRIMSYKGTIAVRPKILEDIADECEFKGKTKVQQVRNKIRELVKLKIIERIDVGTYATNPYLFGRGDWASILDKRINGIEGVVFSTYITDDGVKYKTVFIDKEGNECN